MIPNDEAEGQQNLLQSEVFDDLQNLESCDFKCFGLMDYDPPKSGELDLQYSTEYQPVNKMNIDIPEESNTGLQKPIKTEDSDNFEKETLNVQRVCLNPTTRNIQEISLPPSRIRDAGPKEEEKQGLLEFKIVQNDGTRESLKTLVHLKDIFSKQLPKMPVEYITRLVFDRKHRALCMFRENIPIGGIQFRPFNERNFIEIVFCAVMQSKQVRGYGSHLMNHLKLYAQKEKIYNFLTYADNYAIGYFKKQGFSREIDLDRTFWGGVVKDYDGGTLMHCALLEGIDYMDVPNIIYDQRVALLNCLKKLSSQHIVCEGFQEFKKGYRRIALDNLQPLLDMGWNPEIYRLLLTPEAQRKIYDHNRALINSMKEDKFSWPFLEPVDGSQVPDYYTTILDPIDLSAMDKRLEDGFYITQEILIADIQRMVDNCKRYNGPNNEYFTCAVQLENRLKRWKPISIE